MTRKMPYTVTRREVNHTSYRVDCKICGGVSNHWDFQRNAIWAARSHIQTEHSEVTWLPPVWKVLNPGPWEKWSAA